MSNNGSNNNQRSSGQRTGSNTNTNRSSDRGRGSNTRSSGSGSKRPTHIAWNVREIGPDKSFWERVGVGWMNGDGEGINVELFAFPVNGKLTIRLRKDNDDQDQRDPQEGDR